MAVSIRHVYILRSILLLCNIYYVGKSYQGYGCSNWQFTIDLTFLLSSPNLWCLSRLLVFLRNIKQLCIDSQDRGCITSFEL